MVALLILRSSPRMRGISGRTVAGNRVSRMHGRRGIAIPIHGAWGEAIKRRDRTCV